jgi:hypothetical protein
MSSFCRPIEGGASYVNGRPELIAEEAKRATDDRLAIVVLLRTHYSVLLTAYSLSTSKLAGLCFDLN